MSKLIGFVGYKDEPGIYFRWVRLLPDELDELLTDSRWVTEGCDPDRTAVMTVMTQDECLALCQQAAKLSMEIGTDIAQAVMADGGPKFDQEDAQILPKDTQEITDKKAAFAELAASVSLTGGA